MLSNLMKFCDIMESRYLRIMFELAPPQQPCTPPSTCKVAQQPCTPAHKIIGGWPITTYATEDAFTRWDVGNTDRIYWWRYRMRDQGSLLPGSYLHAHRARYGGFLMVAGRHSVGSLTGKYTNTTTGYDSCPHMFCIVLVILA